MSAGDPYFGAPDLEETPEFLKRRITAITKELTEANQRIEELETDLEDAERDPSEGVHASVGDFREMLLKWIRMAETFAPSDLTVERLLLELEAALERIPDYSGTAEEEAFVASARNLR